MITMGLLFIGAVVEEKTIRLFNPHLTPIAIQSIRRGLSTNHVTSHYVKIYSKKEKSRTML